MSRERGQATVELALLLPLLLVILLGCLDLGRAFSVWTTVANGSREGARYACEHPQASDEVIRQWALRDVTAEGLRADEATVSVSYPGTSKEAAGRGDTVVVAVSSPFELTTLAICGGGPLTITAATGMVIIAEGS